MSEWPACAAANLPQRIAHGFVWGAGIISRLSNLVNELHASQLLLIALQTQRQIQVQLLQLREFRLILAHLPNNQSIHKQPPEVRGTN